MGATVGSFATCCPFPLAEGCQVGGTARWVSIRNPDGSVSIIDPTDGSAVAPANVLDFCPAGQSQSHVTTVAASSVFVIPAANLEAWAVRTLGAGVTLDVNGGGANVLDANEVVENAAQDGDLLSDTVTVTTPAGVTARVSWLTRL